MVTFFDEHDIISDEGDAYVTPHMGHSHWIGKDSLSDKEKLQLKSILKKKVSYLHLQTQMFKQIQLGIVQQLFTIVWKGKTNSTRSTSIYGWAYSWG